MKKVIAIAAAMVLGASMMAMADQTNWMVMVNAYDSAGGAGQTGLTVGTLANATNGLDPTLKYGTLNYYEPGSFTLGSTELKYYATTKIGTSDPGKFDFRAPKPAQTDVAANWVWDIHLYSQAGTSPQATWKWSNAIKVIVKPAPGVLAPAYDWTDAAKGLQHYGYKLTATSGEWYTDAALSNPWSGEWYKQGNLMPTAGLTLYLKNVAASAEHPYGYDGFDNAGTLRLELTPEPGSILALGSGLAGLLGFAIRRKR